MVLVNKVEEMKNKSVYYAQMPTQKLSSGGQQVINPQSLDRPYSVFSPENIAYYRYVYKRVNKAKLAANVFGLVIWIVTLILASMSVSNSNYSNRRFPASFPMYYTKEWHRMDGLDALIQSLSGTTAPTDRVKKVWEWANCSQYITSNVIPKQNHPETLVTLSDTNPVYAPGGCNCLAQVAATMPNNFNVATPHISLDKLKDQFEFCTLFGPMPVTIKSEKSDIFVNSYIYGFLLFACLAVLISNIRHWSFSDYIVESSNDQQKSNQQKEDEQKKNDVKFNNMIHVAKMVTLAFYAASFILFIVLNSKCDQCDPHLNNPNWIWAGLVVTIVALVGGYYGLYFHYDMYKQAAVSLTTMGVVMIEAKDTHKKTDEQWKKILTFSNAKAGEEQLIFDIVLIPTLVLLTIGITVLRSWLDIHMILYNVTLVVFLACFYTSANYISSKWAMKAHDSEKHDSLDQECQLFKVCAIFAGAFIIFALCFTALPAVQPNYYHLSILDNWYVYISALFFIYILPDIINEIWACTLQTMTAMRQWILILFSFFILFLEMKAVWFKNDIFVNSVFK